MGVTTASLPFEPAWCRQRSLLAVGFAEFLSTTLLVYTITLSIAWSPSDATVPVAIAGGVIALCNIFGDLSGAHMNPAITVAYFLAETRFSSGRLTVYIIAEILGAVVGANLAVINGQVIKNPYSVQMHQNFNLIQIGLAEFVWTAFLCMTALRAGFLLSEPSSLTPIWIGGVILAGSYCGGTISGNCMNPALAIAFATKVGSWLDLLVYSLAPTGGGIFAALMAMLIEPNLWARRMGLSDSTANLRISSSGISTNGPPVAGLEMSPINHHDDEEQRQYINSSRTVRRGISRPDTAINVSVRGETVLHQRSASRPA